jgi:hypothetical protein
MSIFYATIADTTLIKNMNITKINNILTMLTTKWDCDNGTLFIVNNSGYTIHRANR